MIKNYNINGDDIEKRTDFSNGNQYFAIRTKHKIYATYVLWIVLEKRQPIKSCIGTNLIIFLFSIFAYYLEFMKEREKF